ncbi:MAG: hypothetical protein E5W57_04105 [Mesorhizobium sp.]|nr:MAG: hypothetical protein E5W57_04105 [Mesorhizobium sp.]
MGQWGKAFTIAGVTVLPHVATNGFDPITMDSPIDDFKVIGREPHADENRARQSLKPFLGKPYRQLLTFLNELVGVPTTADFAGVTFLTHYTLWRGDSAVVTDIRCPKCGIPIEFDQIEYVTRVVDGPLPHREQTGEVIVTVSCHGETWRVSSKYGRLS